jgi:hypothetical protein
MLNKLCDAVFRLRQLAYSDRFSNTDDMKIIVIVSPYAMNTLRAELKSTQYIYHKEVDKYTSVTFFELFGQKIPFILDNTLSKDVAFQVMFRKDYESIEKEKLIEKFYKIFDD